MSGSFFNVENNLIDRNDLNIYEKMCSVVLARYAGRSEFSNMLNTQVIAIRMGCSVAEAEKALNSLIEKKLVTLEDAGHIEPEMLAVEAVKVSSKVIKTEGLSQMVKAPEKAFDHLESFEEETPAPKAKRGGRRKKTEEKTLESSEVSDTKKNKPVESSGLETSPGKAKERLVDKGTDIPEVKSRPLVPKQVREDVQSLIDQIFEIVEENINDREARIILSFANNDVELVREKYKVAKRSQVSDKIEMLINELQKKDDQGAGDLSQPSVMKAETAPKILQSAQVDLENINRMVAFKQSSYGKQGKKL